MLQAASVLQFFVAFACLLILFVVNVVVVDVVAVAVVDISSQ